MLRKPLAGSQCGNATPESNVPSVQFGQPRAKVWLGRRSGLKLGVGFMGVSHRYQGQIISVEASRGIYFVVPTMLMNN